MKRHKIQKDGPLLPAELSATALVDITLRIGEIDTKFATTSPIKGPAGSDSLESRLTKYLGAAVSLASRANERVSNHQHHRGGDGQARLKRLSWDETIKRLQLGKGELREKFSAAMWVVQSDQLGASASELKEMINRLRRGDYSHVPPPFFSADTSVVAPTEEELYKLLHRFAGIHAHPDL